MNIGIIPDPEGWRDWKAIRDFLDPAAKRGGIEIRGNGEYVWAVYDGDLVGAATTRLTVDDFGEVVLVGGKDHRRWIARLDRLICNWMRDEGMKLARAYGRRGWTRTLTPLGWTVIGERDGFTAYEKVLQ